MKARAALRLVWRAPIDATFVPVHTPRAARAMVERWGARKPLPPTPFELEQVGESVRFIWARDRDLGEVPRRDRKHLPYLLFYPPANKAMWLGAEAQFVKKFTDGLAGESRMLASTAYVLLRDYPTELSTFRTLLGGFSSRLLHDSSGRTELWRERHDRFRLFDHDGPPRVAAELLESDKALTDCLSDLGLVDELAHAGFLRHVHDAVLRRLLETLAGRPGPDWLDRPLSFLADPERGLRFPDDIEKIADALLLPHIDLKPRPETKARLEAFLLRHLRDPRLFPQKWQRVSQDAKQVFLRWLVGGTLEDFFRLIEKSAWKQHWAYRRAFWEAYLKRDLIQDAWVALGEEPRSVAKQVFRNVSGLAFGSLSSADRNHSVLLMRIGDLIIAEWSHSGTCRIWKVGSSGSPQLHQMRYSRAELVEDADFEQRHHGNEHYTWQWQVAEYIASETGIRIPTRDYRIRNPR